MRLTRAALTFLLASSPSSSYTSHVASSSSLFRPAGIVATAAFAGHPAVAMIGKTPFTTAGSTTSSRTATSSSVCSSHSPFHDPKRKKTTCGVGGGGLLPGFKPSRRRKDGTLTIAGGLSTRGGSSTSSTTSLNSAVTSDATETDDAETITKKQKPIEIFRKDYKPLPNVVSRISMNFNIHDNLTTVTSKMIIDPNPNCPTEYQNDDLVLDGDETSVTLQSLTLNGQTLSEEKGDYTVSPGKLTISSSLLTKPGSILESVVTIIPETNTQLSGLYKSGSMYCTQCEATGFRRITYYPDRPDNMSIFDNIRIEASKESYPVLLSNGNLIDSGDTTDNDKSEESGDRHYAIWSDPYPKPSYLFCIVAGKLGSIKDTYTTSLTGRKVSLEIFSEEENVNKLDYAMESLKKSMVWDEDKYGLEYDLDVYNIVAVNDFNMGAMENKGLNVFNTAYVLTNPQTATDTDYERVEGVIGHEYFHNWTGNRVTCRDWFQLTLKEGLTVFRDQEFSGDLNSNAVKRIEDVKGLRGRQFNEDGGPMSHPIRPESYISMDNFYTATVYSKGAEVIRMYQTLLTPAGFRRGMDLYFQRHDGSAVTCDDFRSAMADANDVNLDQFGLWYSTPGTPTVTYSSEYDEESKVFKLTLKQSSKCEEGALHIPVSVGLIDRKSGKEVVPTTVLELKELEQTFTFENVMGDVVPSVLRDFSAPVKLVRESSTEKDDDEEQDLAFLAANDTDMFNKWESIQKLYTSLIFQHMNNNEGDASSKTLDYVNEAFGRTLDASRETTDYSIMAYALTLPAESTLAEEVDIVDPVAIRSARSKVKKAIAREYQSQIQTLYDDLTQEMESESGEFKVDALSIGKRRLRNVLLDYLTSIRDTDSEKTTSSQLAYKHFTSASGMTDKMAALSALSSMHGDTTSESLRDEAMQQFYDDANGDALVLNKWFSVQALANLPDVLDRVIKLTSHPDFTLTNPNRCRSLIGAFAMNAAPFHAENGEGYKFLGDILTKLDKINPQVSSRLANNLITWRKFNETRGTLMKNELEKLVKMEGISDDLFEVVSRGLKE